MSVFHPRGLVSGRSRHLLEWQFGCYQFNQTGFISSIQPFTCAPGHRESGVLRCFLSIKQTTHFMHYLINTFYHKFIHTNEIRADMKEIRVF